MTRRFTLQLVHGHPSRAHQCASCTSIFACVEAGNLPSQEATCVHRGPKKIRRNLSTPENRQWWGEPEEKK